MFVSGAFTAPKDIPTTVAEASGAASKAGALVSENRVSIDTVVKETPEIDVKGQEPRIGVFVCDCGINISGTVDVPSVVEYAKTLPNVVFAEENKYTCSADSQERIKELIKEHKLNRVVVASCTPRTHEALFQSTIKEAGLNLFLFEMANIRDQCSWIHMHEPEKATQKSKDLVRMAIAKSRLLEPLSKSRLGVTHSAVVVGGGLAGMTAALDIAQQGFKVELIERTGELGGKDEQAADARGRKEPEDRHARDHQERPGQQEHHRAHELRAGGPDRIRRQLQGQDQRAGDRDRRRRRGGRRRGVQAQGVPVRCRTRTSSPSSSWRRSCTTDRCTPRRSP